MMGCQWVIECVNRAHQSCLSEYRAGFVTRQATYRYRRLEIVAVVSYRHEVTAKVFPREFIKNLRS